MLRGMGNCCRSRHNSGTGGIQGGRSDSRSRSNRGRSYTNRVESENTGNNTIDTVEATVMPLDSTVFTVKRVNLFINDNSIAHKTQDYYANGSRDDHIILRRGFPITMQLLFSRDYIPNKDIVNLTFTVADVDQPSYSKKTEVIVPVVLNNRNGRFSSLSLASTSSSNGNTLTSATDPLWSATVKSIQGNLLTIIIITSHNAIIGEWNLKIETRESGIPLTFHVDHKFILLFNPWNKKDDTYLPSERERQEYILNQNGLIWRGVHNVMRPSPWIYGQFEDYILECACMALSYVGYLHPSDRSDVVKVTRHIAAIVNSHDDKGIIEGNWTTDYSGGRAPTSWTGSPSILQQFFRTRRPVRYGQCWVFAGVAATVCRTLGIPARCVTNYQSAHDTHKSLTVDRFFNENLEPLDIKNTDSIWTFHVWTEAWMARSDLPNGNDGWQVVDATPQELSSGLFRCGPASVASVKRGEIQLPYDAAFIYAEVNADEVFWMYDETNQSYKLLDFQTASIGQNISTKAVASTDRQDITDTYKHPEKSREERSIMHKVLRRSNSMFARYYLNQQFTDVKFNLILLDDIVIGEPFTVRLRIVNSSDKVYTVVTSMLVRSTYYTGEPHEVVKDQRRELTLPPESEQELSMLITFTEYELHLIDQNSFSVLVTADVREVDYQFSARDDFRVRMPDIKFDFEGDAIVGSPLTIYASLLNPIPRNLTRCYFIVEGAGLTEPLKLPVKRTVPIGGEARVGFKIYPKTSGDKVITGKFISRELGSDVDGYRSIRVAPAPSLTFDERVIDLNDNELRY